MSVENLMTVAPNLQEFYAAVPAAAELDATLGVTVLDVFGVEYDDLGQQNIATACGSGHSNGCDLDGE